jgi:uncharacterized Zn-binding protein involved in type VI secretion
MERGNARTLSPFAGRLPRRKRIRSALDEAHRLEPRREPREQLGFRSLSPDSRRLGPTAPGACVRPSSAGSSASSRRVVGHCGRHQRAAQGWIGVSPFTERHPQTGAEPIAIWGLWPSVAGCAVAVVEFQVNGLRCNRLADEHACTEKRHQKAAVFKSDDRLPHLDLRGHAPAHRGATLIDETLCCCAIWARRCPRRPSWRCPNRGRGDRVLLCGQSREFVRIGGLVGTQFDGVDSMSESFAACMPGCAA